MSGQGTAVYQSYDTIGFVPSGAFTSAEIYGTLPGGFLAGSSAGVPAPATVDQSGVQATIDYATSVSNRSPINHPLFWAVALTVIGMAGLGFVAHSEVRRGR